MKKTLLFAVSMFTSSLLWSQLELNLEIEFSQTERDFQPLEEYTNITEAFGVWDRNSFDLGDLVFDLTTNFVMPGFEERPLHFMETAPLVGFGLGYVNRPEDPYELHLVGSPMDENFILSPLVDPSNTDEGHILFYEGDGILKIEFRNVAFERELNLGDGNLTSRANFLVEVDFETKCMEFHYGPANISSELENALEGAIPVYTSFEYVYEEYVDGQFQFNYGNLFAILGGDPTNPELQKLLSEGDFDEQPNPLNSLPKEGTVYQFCYDQTTSVDETILENPGKLNLYPNPATDIVQIKPRADSRIKQVLVYDQMGRVVSSTKGSREVDVSHLPSGLYVIGVDYDGVGDFQFGKLLVE
ncbi:MAG: T9SS C-terminal target domain-containing protein [Saprospirales bacterium]|nr:MAG: T9SS C-terminal target domain-containing protein [Saprospirales bacterium]